MLSFYRYRFIMADAPNPARSDLLAGTLEMLILRTLSLGSLHGYAIAQHIGRLSESVLKVEQGSLYPALERLLRRGWVTARWGSTPTKRKARYYTITRSGRAQLREKTSDYERVVHAIGRIMRRA
jgi:PadR family transcriptional regulator PadR